MLRSRLNEFATARAAKYLSKTDTDTSSAQIGRTESEDPSSIAATEYYSIQSTIAETIMSQTDSTGLQSQRGATWQHSMAYTANSGFASGLPRTMGWKGVREGRERELGLEEMKGVGRTGKRAAPVPDGLIKAVGGGLAGEEQIGPQVEARNEFSSTLEDGEMEDGTAKAQAKTNEEFEQEIRRRGAERIMNTWEPSDMPYNKAAPPSFKPISTGTLDFDEWTKQEVRRLQAERIMDTREDFDVPHNEAAPP